MNLSFSKLVRSFVAAVVFFILPALAFASDIFVGFDAVFTNATYTIGTDSATGITSITVSDSDISVTLAPGEYIRLVTNDRKEVTLNDTSGLTISTECSSSQYITRIEVSSSGSQRSFTISPNSTTCTSGSGSSGTSTGSGGSGGGGGGGGGISLPASSAVSVSTPAPVSSVTATPAPAPVAAAASAVFTKDLVPGALGGEVSRLQELLAADKSIYPEGLVTGYYGPATTKAVRAFQAKYGISQVGRVGPATRAKLAEVFGAGQPPAAVSVPAAPVAAGLTGLTKELNQGVSGDDVKALQEFLAKDSSLYPEGLVTGYYGPATTRAVKRFQATYGISQVGRVGPATLKKLQEVMGAAPVSTAAPTPASTPVPAVTTPAVTPAPTPAPAPTGLTPDPEITGGFKYRMTH